MSYKHEKCPKCSTPLTVPADFTDRGDCIKCGQSFMSGAADHLHITNLEYRVKQAEKEVEALKAARDQALDAANQHAAMRQKAEAEVAELKKSLSEVRENSRVHNIETLKRAGEAEQSALALALECKEKTEALEAVNNYVNQALGGVESANKGDYPRACRAVRNRTKDALSRSASHYTRVAEAMGKAFAALAKYRADGFDHRDRCPVRDSTGPCSCGMKELIDALDSISEEK